jgi:hypothetical protein
VRAKILYVSGYDSYDSNEIVTEATNWEEVTEEEVKLLTRNANNLPEWNGLRARFVVESGIPLKDTVRGVIEKLAAADAAEKARVQKAAEKRRLRDAAKKKATEEQKRELLARLKEELGEG